MDSKRILSLEAVRGLAFLGVVFCHTDINAFRSTGTWAVSVFLVISGFVMVKSYYGQERITETGVVANFKFACSKIKKLYVLHVLLTFCMAVLLLGKESIKTIITKLLLNLLLIQEYVPFYDRSINGVSWYLCVLFLFYFVFPWVIQFIEKRLTIKKAYCSLAILFVIQLIFGLIGRAMPAREFVSGDLWEFFLTQWFVYYFPITRLLDMLIGCVIGYIFINKEHSLGTAKYTILEIASVSLAVIANVIYAFTRPKMQIEASSRVADPSRWWTWGVLFIFSSGMLVYCFAIGKGFISKLITGKVTLFLAKISSSAFLIHYVVFRYLIIVYYHLPNIDGRSFTLTYGGYISMTLGLMITSIASLIWMKIEKRFIK